MAINFETTAQDFDVISKLARRARAVEKTNQRPVKDWMMDFTAVHVNGCPLRLNDLLEADDFNFMHDAFGICRHLNRETGALENHFSPRYHA